MNRLYLRLMRRRVAKTKRLYKEEGPTDRVQRRIKTDANLMSYAGISQMDDAGIYYGPMG